MRTFIRINPTVQAIMWSGTAYTLEEIRRESSRLTILSVNNTSLLIQSNPRDLTDSIELVYVGDWIVFLPEGGYVVVRGKDFGKIFRETVDIDA